MSLGEAVVDIGANTADFERQAKTGVDRGLSSASKSVEKFGRGMTSVGTKMTAGVTAPILGAGAAALKVAGDFDQTMSVLQAATGSTAGDMAKFEEQAKTLGAQTVFSANEAAEAMLELGKAGQSTTEIMASVPEVMNLAATEGLALDNAAGIVTATLSQFGMSADESAIAVNALAGASNASRSSVASLAEGMKFAGSAAAGIGMDVQETSAALAALSQAGLDGGIAGTALAGIFNRLVPQTKKARDAMNGLGLDFTNANGEFDDMATIAEKLRGSLGEMDEESRKIAIGQIFGRNAGTLAAVNALIGEGAEGINKYADATANQDAASSMAEARMKGLKGALEEMSGSIETAALAFGQALSPMISKAAGWIGKIADRFSTLSPTAQKVILVVAGIAAAIGPLLIVSGMLITAVGTIAGVFAGLTAAVAAPVAAIALIAVGLGVLFAKSEEARAVVAGAFTQIKDAVMGAVGPIAAQITGVWLPAFQSVWPVIEKVGVVILKVFAGAVVGAVKGAIQAISGIVTIVTGVVQVVSGVLTGDWSKAWSGLKNIVKGALDAVIGIVRVALNVSVLGLFRKGFTLLKTVVTSGWKALTKMFSKETGSIGKVMSKITDIITLPFRVAFRIARTVVTGAWNAIKAVFTFHLNLVKALLTGNLGQAQGIIRGAMGAIRGIFQTGWNALKGVVSRAWEAIKGAVSTGVQNAVGVVRGLPGKAADAIRGGVSSMLSAGRALIGGLVEGISGRISDAVDKVKGGLSKIKGLLPGSPIKWGPLTSWNNGGAGKRLMGLLGEGIRASIPAVVQATADVTGAIARRFEDVEVGPAVQKITEGYEGALEAITEATQEQYDKRVAAAESTFASQKKAYEKDVAAQRAALKKKHDGKVLKKRLAALEREEDRHLKALEKQRDRSIKGFEKDRRASNAALSSLAQQNRSAVMAMAGEWDRLNGVLSGVQDRLSDAMADLRDKTDQMLSYASKVSESLVESIFKPGDAKTPVTFDRMIDSLREQESAAKRYGEVMQGLISLGLNDTSFQQYADAGTDGLAAAEALLRSGAAGVAQVNALQSSINTYAKTAGDLAAERMYGAGVRTAQGVVDGLRGEESALVSQMQTLGQAMADAFESAMAQVTLPSATVTVAGAGGGGGGNQKHQWEPVGKNNRKCRICGRPRGASIHTNRGGKAAGDLSFDGGWTKVGENGPELIRLPAGSRVYPAHTTERMEQGSQQPVEIHVHMPTGDPEAAAQSVMNRLARRGR